MQLVGLLIAGEPNRESLAVNYSSTKSDLQKGPQINRGKTV